MVMSKKNRNKIQVKETKTDRIYLGFVYFVVLFATVITLYPLIFIVSASFSTPQYVNSGEMWLWPMGFTMEGYAMILGNNDIWRGYANTIYYTVLGTLIHLAVTLPIAYAVSRPELYGKKYLMIFLTIPMFIGGGLIPFFLLIQWLGWMETVWPLVIPGATGLFSIVITRTFFNSNIPREMEEAAIIDGSSDFYLFFKIVLPLSAPIIAVMALFNGIGHWNAWFSAMLFLPDRSQWPLQMVLREILVQQNLTSMPEAVMGMDASAHELIMLRQQMAQVIRYGVIVVSTLPIIMVYPFLQKYFVKGVLVGSIKG